ncbi:MAG: hypothetical protein AAGC88_03940 [Bacteroidota bacterium]
MRSIVIVLLFVSTQAFSQSYTAIHVIGKIYLPEKQTYLKRGTKLSESEKIEFQSAGAKAAMLSSSRGRYIIQENSKSASSDNLSFALSSIITPVKGQMSTRAGGINNALDFEKQLGKAPVAWLNEEMPIEVSGGAYPMDENRFFYMAYSYGGETINKKLSYTGQSLLLIKSEFFKVDGQAVNPSEVDDMKLYYYDMEKGEEQLITSPMLVPVSSNELKGLKEGITEGDDALLEFVNSLYGKCTKEQLDAALASLN